MLIIYIYISVFGVTYPMLCRMGRPSLRYDREVFQRPRIRCHGKTIRKAAKSPQQSTFLFPAKKECHLGCRHILYGPCNEEQNPNPVDSIGRIIAVLLCAIFLATPCANLRRQTHRWAHNEASHWGWLLHLMLETSSQLNLGLGAGMFFNQNRH